MIGTSKFFGAVLVVWAGILSLSASAAFAGGGVPDCLSYGKPLEDNSRQVLHWKRTTENQFQERGNITGTITQVLPDRNGHIHFIIDMGLTNDSEDTIEVIYNQEFGAVPDLAPGMTVQACGDYITSTAQSGPYPASPVGAIIHWVHANPRGKGHESGFLVVNGTVCGQDAENAGPNRREQPRRRNKKRPRP